MSTPSPAPTTPASAFEPRRDAQAPGYRRRRRWPAVALLIVLAVVGSMVWSRVLATSAEVAEGVVACPKPSPPDPAATEQPEAPPPALGAPVEPEVFTDAPPAAPRDAPVRVLNANGQRGQASLVSAQLSTELGFGAPKGASANDPIYTAQDMDCVGQIRFGPQALAQARSVHLVVPCAELIQDEREGVGVDLALGARFRDLSPGADATTVLSTLEAGTAEAPAEVDPELLEAASEVRC